MVWEQQSTLIVMVTTLMERGRSKCHKYWPKLYDVLDLGLLRITCIKEQESASFAFREFTLINSEVNLIILLLGERLQSMEDEIYAVSVCVENAPQNLFKTCAIRAAVPAPKFSLTLCY